MSLKIRDDFWRIKEELLIDTTVDMEVALNLPDGMHKMVFSGIVTWNKRVKKKVYNALYLTVPLHNLDENSAGMHKEYSALGAGEKTLSGICGTL